jgi:hypothetical protein
MWYRKEAREDLTEINNIPTIIKSDRTFYKA